ncbi:MAG: single-stranded DNA-binding protein [Candidatus Cloacimonetes bacterium]|nr:single-stranded DNA-binding protein [Candidatus Cloacimonadota bacterium]MBS3766947.1 single-stranded DNA-binding protein [Candidatus Cloacimonadota bacterium]
MTNRAPNINQITISGNLVRKPEVQYVGDNDTALCKITLANNRSYLNKDKDWQQETTFVDCEIWGSLAERVEKNSDKGSPLIVEGVLKQNTWEDKNGNTHSKLLIRAQKIHILQQS